MSTNPWNLKLLKNDACSITLNEVTKKTSVNGYKNQHIVQKNVCNLEPLEGIHQKSFTLLETSLLKDYGNMLVCHPKIGSSYPKSCTWKAQIHYQQISLIRPYWKSNQSEWSSYLSKNKIFGTEQKNPVKLDWIRKVWYLLLRAFWLLLPKFNF